MYHSYHGGSIFAGEPKLGAKKEFAPGLQLIPSILDQVI